MQQAVQDQDTNLITHCVAKMLCLLRGNFKRDSEIAGEFLLRRECRSGASRKAEDISWFVLAAELPVQPPQRRIIGQQHMHFALESHSRPRKPEKAQQRGPRQACFSGLAYTLRRFDRNHCAQRLSQNGNGGRIRPPSLILPQSPRPYCGLATRWIPG